MVVVQLSGVEVEIGSADEAAYYYDSFVIEVIMLVKRPSP